MKKLIFTLLCAVFMGITVNAQSVTAAQVPSAIKKAMMMKYPKASGVQWEKQASNYEAQFMLGNNWTTANFDAAGVWLQTSSFMDPEAVPANISAAAQKDVPGGNIISATMVEKNKAGKTYLVQYATETDAYNLVYSADAKLISKEKEVYETTDDEASDY
ncbi:MAG: hypothetical protein RLZZ337_482 [Bacteroidota bacterium]|jgi:hypothetical protein